MFLLSIKRKLYFLKWAYAFFSNIFCQNQHTQQAHSNVLVSNEKKKKKAPIPAQKQRNEYLTEFVPIQQ